MIPYRGLSSVGTTPALLRFPTLIRAILELVHRGWITALANDPTLTASQNERFMNGSLARGMNAARPALGIDNIWVIETPGERSHPALAIPDRAPDVVLVIAQFGAEQAPHAIIECKRLDPDESPKQLRSEYVREGINRFVGQQYGRAHDIGFMAGYVLRGNEAAALNDLNECLDGIGRSSERLVQDASYGTAAGFIACSTHVRGTDPIPFVLLHSFLPFPAKRSYASAAQRQLVTPQGVQSSHSLRSREKFGDCRERLLLCRFSDAGNHEAVDQIQPVVPVVAAIAADTVMHEQNRYPDVVIARSHGVEQQPTIGECRVYIR
jgi:hypothetical protein